MLVGLLHTHSALRWILLILLITILVKAFIGRGGDKAFTAQDRKITLFLLIASHLQLVIGMVQYFVSEYGAKYFENFTFGEIMKNKTMRFFAIEHLVTMLIAIVLITVANGVSKKQIDDTTKWNRLFWLYLAAFLLIMVGIPWPFREVGFGRGWF
jgi:cytochrome bd-type quinol oxidase subunit 2